MTFHISEGSAYMFGRGLTSVLWGVVADKYGQKPVIKAGLVAMLVFLNSKHLHRSCSFAVTRWNSLPCLTCSIFCLFLFLFQCHPQHAFWLKHTFLDGRHLEISLGELVRCPWHNYGMSSWWVLINLNAWYLAGRSVVWYLKHSSMDNILKARESLNYQYI